MKHKTILSTKLARALLKNGFKLVDVKPNNKTPERTVFVFESTPELINSIEIYKNKVPQTQ